MKNTQSVPDTFRNGYDLRLPTRILNRSNMIKYTKYENTIYTNNLSGLFCPMSNIFQLKITNNPEHQ